MSWSTWIKSSSRLKEARRYMACGLIGLFVAAFGTNVWLTYLYIGTRPMAPNVALGLVRPRNNHGAYYYLSATESASVTLAFWGGWLAIMLVFIIVPKDFIIPPPQTPRWVTHVSASFKTGLEEFSFAYFAIMISALLISFAVIFLFGQRLAHFAAVHGVSAN
jgi:hypothetical protein